ncbi:MAG TPA: DNA-processing protein DprA [Anaeromyxobacteraceae bacterium]|nr:DNA-processing protein DprA [Anaeromyxobacteraceae bacterium]
MQLEPRTLRPGDAEYPAPLARIPDPPQRLRVRGDLRAGAPRVAIVGPRQPDEYGVDVARELATGLARAGVTVVSGGAAGIDAAAHDAAMRAGGHTIAVFGTGIDVLFPASNRGLFARILETGGALVSGLEDGQRGAQWTFPERNRLVSGMSAAVVVVQAAPGSGALITADHAFAQRVEVLAVPGDVRNPLSAGPHALLRRGAGLVASARDVLAVIGLEGQLTLGMGAAPALEGAEAALYGVLARVPRHADELARAARLPAGQAIAGLLALEVRGLCEQRPGNYFARRS